MYKWISVLGLLLAVMPQNSIFSTEQNPIILKSCTMKLPGGNYRGECGMLTVPENWGTASTSTINLPITRIRTVNPNPAEPIFYFAGGPGMSNMKFQPPIELIRNHDIVLVGYRGVDGSVVLDCPQVNQAMKGVNGQLMSSASQQVFGEAVQKCTRELENRGVDISAYTIPAVIADFEAARKALGYERINLLSQSYGTRIALLYAQQYPDQIHRSVMIGVNPPGRFVWEPGKVDEQLAYYSQLYARQFPGTDKTSLVETMRTVNRHMPNHWLFFPIDPGKVKATRFAMLFSKKTAASIFDAYLAASKGDASGLALLSTAYDYVLPGMMTWGDFMAKGFSADYDPQRKYEDLGSRDSVIGSPLAELFWPHASKWPAPVIPEEFRHVKPSAVETLLISGSVDFSTPAEYATNELLPYLKKGHQVIVTEAGHTDDLWNTQSKATERLLTHYYETGEVDASLYVHQPMSFDPGWMRFPAIAKVLVAGMVFTGSVLVFGMMAIIRLLRKRNQQHIRARSLPVNPTFKVIPR